MDKRDARQLAPSLHQSCYYHQHHQHHHKCHHHQQQQQEQLRKYSIYPLLPLPSFTHPIIVCVLLLLPLLLLPPPHYPFCPPLDDIHILDDDILLVRFQVRSRVFSDGRL